MYSVQFRIKMLIKIEQEILLDFVKVFKRIS